MIKQRWHIPSEEKIRILQLHENATKNQYLQREQHLTGASPEYKPQKKEEGEVKVLPTPSDIAWRVCGFLIYNREGRYFLETKNGMIQIPKLSEISGTIVDKGRKFEFDDLTKVGLYWGDEMYTGNENPESPCIGRRASATYGQLYPFLYFDDIADNLPKYGGLGDTSNSRGFAGNDMIDVKYKKEKEGVTLKFGRTRTKNYVINVVDVFKGRPQEYTPKPETRPQPEELRLELNLQSPFKYDEVLLTPEGAVEFEKFVENLKKYINYYSGNVEVITSASIDAEPKTKAEYNLRLSQRRANYIIEELKKRLGDTKLNFIARPLGQTDQFEPGLKWPEVKDYNKTAPNRRLIIKLPKITIPKN